MPGPNANGFASQWNIGLRVLERGVCVEYGRCRTPERQLQRQSSKQKHAGRTTAHTLPTDRGRPGQIPTGLPSRPLSCSQCASDSTLSFGAAHGRPTPREQQTSW